MQKHISTETRVQNLEFGEAFKILEDREKNYAYFLSKSSWAGCKMVLHQLCYEAPPLFLIFQCYFMSKDFFALENAALAGGATKEEYQQFVAYVAGFYGNLSNYHSFGHMKFIPECSPEAFKKILCLTQ